MAINKRWLFIKYLKRPAELSDLFLNLSVHVSNCQSTTVTKKHYLRELSFFTGRGGVCLWSRGANFFLSPHWHAQKNLVPPSACAKNSAPPLCDPQKIFVPPFGPLKKTGPPLWLPQKILVPPTNGRPPRPEKMIAPLKLAAANYLHPASMVRTFTL